MAAAENLKSKPKPKVVVPMTSERGGGLLSPSSRAAREQRDAAGFDNHLGELLQGKETTCIGSYMLGETIGKGTYGEVKLGVHTITKQLVAVKIMAKSFGPIALREVQTWRHLRHPNIVQLYDVITTESHIYLVMEYASRGEIFEYIVSRGKMKEKEAKKVFSQLVSAVQYCHKKNFVHRDLKPENLLLDAQNNLKLIDFGFTRPFDQGKLLDTYCGSVAYVAPEIVKKEKYSGPESDVWSLGVILFALLCGRLPFDDENDAKVFEKILEVNYKIDEACSPAAVDLIERILKNDPKERLTIEEILAHEWLRVEESGSGHSHGLGSGEFSPPIVETGTQIDGFDQVGTSELDESIIAGMEGLGMDVVHLKQSLQNYQPNSITALFFLLKKAKSPASLPYSGDSYFPRTQKPVMEAEKIPEKSNTSLLTKSLKADAGSSQSKSKKPSGNTGKREKEARKGSLTGDLSEITEEHIEEEEEMIKSGPTSPDKYYSLRGISTPNLKEQVFAETSQKGSLGSDKTPFGSPSRQHRFKMLFSGGATRKETSVKARGRTASLDTLGSSDMVLPVEQEPVRDVKDGAFDTRNTSTKNPDELVKEVVRVLTSLTLAHKQKDYCFIIQGDTAKISEVCEGRRKGLELDREGEVLSQSSRVVDPIAVDNSDSNDGGARDSLEETPEDREMYLTSASSSSSTSPSPEKMLRFELEICRLGPKLHGLKLKRLEGDVWAYKELCDKLLQEMRL